MEKNRPIIIQDGKVITYKSLHLEALNMTQYIHLEEYHNLTIKSLEQWLYKISLLTKDNKILHFELDNLDYCFRLKSERPMLLLPPAPLDPL